MNRIGTYWPVTTLLAVFVLALAACTAAAPSPGASGGSKQDAKQERVKLTMAYSAVEGSFAPFFVAKEAGIFDKYGLDVDLVSMESGPKTAQAMIGGDVQFAAIGGVIVNATLAGGDGVLVATSAPIMPYQLITVKSINSPKDLKGQKLAVSSLGSTSHFAVKLALREMGLKEGEDVGVIAAGSQGSRLAAMQAGGAQGTVASPPISKAAENMGFKVLADLSEMKLAYQQAGLGTTRRYIKEHEDVVKRMVKAHVESIYYFKTQKQVSLDVLKKYLKIEDQAALEEAYDYFATKVIPEVPYVSEKSILTALEENSANPKAATAKPEDFYDNRYVKELEDSGFIKSLYQKK